MRQINHLANLISNLQITVFNNNRLLNSLIAQSIGLLIQMHAHNVRIPQQIKPRMCSNAIVYSILSLNLTVALNVFVYLLATIDFSRNSPNSFNILKICLHTIDHCV